jgi:hypothetical protein
LAANQEAKMKLIATMALLLPTASVAEAPPAPAPRYAQKAPMPNAHDRDQRGCRPIARQVAGEDRVHNGTRLDQQPAAQLMLAVDRQVAGCREVTIIRRNVGTATPEPRR